MKDNFTKKNMKLWVEFPKIIIEKKFILGHMYYVCMQSTTEEKNKHFKCYQRKKRQITYNGRTIRDNKYLRSKSETVSRWTHIFKELREKKHKPKSLCSKRMRAK